MLLGLGGLALTTTGFGRAPQRTFHVSPEGDDSNRGSKSSPWRSLARVNAAPLEPGSEVIFARSGRWSGETLMVRPGVTYRAAEGDGPLPRLAGASGPGVVFDEGVAAARIDSLEVISTKAGAVWIDKAGPGNSVLRCRFSDNVHDGARTPNLAGYHTPDLTIAGCDFSRAHGDDHVYLFNCARAEILGNRIEWTGPQDGDCIHVTNCDDFLIAGNDLIYRAGGKGCVMVSPWREDQRPGTIEDNRITGGQYGLSPRVQGCKVRRNHIRRVGLQEDAQDWSSGLWLATGGHAFNAHGITVSDCVIESCPRGIFGWDDLEQQSTGVRIRNCVIANCDETYFGHDNGRIEVWFHNNIAINCGRKRLFSRRAFIRMEHNHFHLTDGEPDDGPPGLAPGFFAPAGAAAHGLGLSGPLSF